MKVILRETIEALGAVGDEVDVAKGYARNYLIPQNKAVLGTPANRMLVEKDRKKLKLQALKDKSRAEVQAQALEGTVCTITAKVSEEDRLYGSVSARDIWDQLKAQGVDLDKKMIVLSEPIKTLGSYLVPVQLHPEVKPEITVKVIAEE
jgi:large subunit ribosomal protein L9